MIEFLNNLYLTPPHWKKKPNKTICNKSNTTSQKKALGELPPIPDIKQCRPKKMTNATVPQLLHDSLRCWATLIFHQSIYIVRGKLNTRVDIEMFCNTDILLQILATEYIFSDNFNNKFSANSNDILFSDVKNRQVLL